MVGLLPGIGGAATLALMLPFVFKMSPVEAFAFVLGMHSVAATTGDITSILSGVPGEGLSAATVVDGHPMAKQGEAARALGAALMSSLVGALIGAAALAVSIPIVRPLQILREAFAKAAKDAEFVAEAKKAKIAVAYIPPGEVLKLFNGLLDQPAEVQKEMVKYIKFGS